MGSIPISCNAPCPGEPPSLGRHRASQTMSSGWAYKGHAQPPVPAATAASVATKALSRHSRQSQHHRIRAPSFAHTQNTACQRVDQLIEGQAQRGVSKFPCQCRHASLPTEFKWVTEPLGLRQPSPGHRRAIRRARRTGSTPPPWHWSAAPLAAIGPVELAPFPLTNGLAETPKIRSASTLESGSSRNRKLQRHPHVHRSSQHRTATDLPSRSKCRTASPESNQRSSSKTS